MIELQGLVEDLAHDGAGIVKVENKVYFVHGALSGEQITFTAGRKRKGRFVGVLISILQPSDDRVEPHCEYFGICGGCSLQHLNADRQFDFKQQQLFENLNRLGKVEPKIRLPGLQGTTTNYRRKARLGVKNVPKKGGVLVGFRERNSGFITSLNHCSNLENRISKWLPDLHKLLDKCSIVHRIPQVEVAAGDHHVALVIRHLDDLTASDEFNMVEFARANAVQLFSQRAGLDSVKPIYPEQPESLNYRLDDHGIVLEFKPTDFIQVNAEVNAMLVNAVIQRLQLSRDDRVLDLFCGLGNFTLPVARKAGFVLGIEGETCLVDAGNANAAKNQLLNTEFKKFDLQQENIKSESIKSILAGGHFNKMLIDPPRSGAREVVSQIVPIVQPQILVYVSCNPATLARDADIMVNHNGYTLTQAGAIDMFPHTAHIESMAVFQLS